MSFPKYFFILLATHGVIVRATVQFFLYPIPIPGRALSSGGIGGVQPGGLSSFATVASNGIITPFSNFHFQARNVHDGSYHFGYDAGM